MPKIDEKSRLYQNCQLFGLILPNSRRNTYKQWEIFQVKHLVESWHKRRHKYYSDKKRLGIIISHKHEIITGHITGVSKDGIEFQHNATGYNPGYTILDLNDYIALEPKT